MPSRDSTVPSCDSRFAVDHHGRRSARVSTALRSDPSGVSAPSITTDRPLRAATSRRPRVRPCGDPSAHTRVRQIRGARSEWPGSPSGRATSSRPRRSSVPRSPHRTSPPSNESRPPASRATRHPRRQLQHRGSPVASSNTARAAFGSRSMAVRRRSSTRGSLAGGPARRFRTDLDRLLRRVRCSDHVTERPQLFHLLAGVSAMLASGPSRSGEAVAGLPGADRGHRDLEQIGDRPSRAACHRGARCRT